MYALLKGIAESMVSLQSAPSVQIWKMVVSKLQNITAVNAD